jgi:hypothetical protein
MIAAESRSSLWKSIRWIGISVLFVGIAAILGGQLLKPDWHFWAEFLIHLGVALVVASLVGFLLELSEFREFFENRLIGILTGKELIDLMNDQHLLDLHGKIVRGLARRRVNNPAHDYENYVSSVCDRLAEYAGIRHRKNQAETIHYSVLNDAELVALGLDATKLHGLVGKTEVRLRYQVVSPRVSEPDVDEFGWSWWVREVPGLALEKHYEFTLSVDGQTITPKNTNPVKRVKWTVEFDIEEKLPFQGTAWVEAKMVYYEYGLEVVFQSTFGALTHNASVHFASREPLELFARMFGVADDNSDPSIAGNSVSIQYPGWVLPQHGYYISLSKAVPNRSGPTL